MRKAAEIALMAAEEVLLRSSTPLPPERLPTLPGEIADCPLCEEPHPIGHAHRCPEMAHSERKFVVLEPEKDGGYRLVNG